MLPKRLARKDRNSRRSGGDLLADLVDERRVRATASKMEKSAALGSLREWDVDGRAHILLKKLHSSRGHDADDLNRLRISGSLSAELDVLPKRLAVRPEFPRQCLVDDGDR